MSVHPGKHKVGKLPLCVLIARQKWHKDKLGLEELESEYFQDRIFEMEHINAAYTKKIYKAKPADLILTASQEYKLKMSILTAALIKKNQEDEDENYEPTAAYYKSYFEKRGLYVGA